MENAKAFALKELDRSPVINNDTGWEISFGNKHLSKLFSQSSIIKSLSPEHWQVISAIRNLVKNAVLSDTHTDRKAKGNSGEDHIAAVHRLYAPVAIGKKLLRVKLTIYEMKDELQGKKFKNYELAEIDLPMRDGEMANQASPTSPLALAQKPDSVSITDLLKNAIRDSDGLAFDEDT